MRTDRLPVPGDTPGSGFELVVHRFEGRDPAAPSAYLQAALHGEEVPGTAALHRLIPRLAEAEGAGRLAGSVTVVPYANPVGLGQSMLGDPSGRFFHANRTNFNRAFPRLARPDAGLLPPDGALGGVDARLKARLLALSLGHELVLDLHCDDEGPTYLYVASPFWPGLSDLAACLGAAAVLVWSEGSDGAFEEAAAWPHEYEVGTPAHDRRAVTTVEFRGIADVSPDLAEADAEGLYRFLVARGTVLDPDGAPPAPYAGPVVPLENVEMVRSPAGGAVLYHVRPGDAVTAGDLLAEVLERPGEAGGAVAVMAPQDGIVLTRRSRRVLRRGDDVLKLLGKARSSTAAPGTLES